MLEAASDILDGASKGNSALLHTGFDAPPRTASSLRCMQAGYREYLAIKDQLNLPLVESGALVVAWDEEQLAKLPAIVATGASATASATSCRSTATNCASASRPSARRGLGAVHVPGEHIIDPWSAPLAYAHQGLAHGGKILRALPRHRRQHSTARAGRCRRRSATSRAGVVINAAGNHGDLVEAINRPTRLRHHAAQGPVRRVRQAGRPSCCTPSSCRCRPSAPRASSSAAPPSAICWSARRRRTRRIATRAEVDHAMLEQLIAKGVEMMPEPRARTR